MIVFEYFFDKMSVFGPKMDGIKKVRLFVSLYVHCLCNVTDLLHQELITHSSPSNSGIASPLS